MFLREDEISDLGYCSVNEDLTIVKEGGRIVGICFIIQGKCDKVKLD
jgi:hypothetical protein